jgi:hypothetical protein
MPKSYYAVKFKLSETTEFGGHCVVHVSNGWAHLTLLKGHKHDADWQIGENHKAGVREIPDLNGWQLWKLHHKGKNRILGKVEYALGDGYAHAHSITATDRQDFHCQALDHALSLVLSQKGVAA